MTLTVANVLENAHCSIKHSMEEITEAPEEKDDDCGATGDSFWLELGLATQKVSSEVAKLTSAFAKPPIPDVIITEDLISGVEAAWTSLLSASLKCPPKGALIRKELRAAVVNTGDSLAALLNALKMAESEPQLTMAGFLWEACSAFEKLPRDNVAATRDLLAREQMLVTDAILEIEDVKYSRFSEDEEVDNSSVWTNQDRELLSPCVRLVRTARVSIKKVAEAVRVRGDCRELEGVEELDRLATAAEKLSPAVDSFVSAVYPPMNKSAVSATALCVVSVVRKFLELARQSSFTTECDEEWLSVLLGAVDLNNNKVQPLVSPD